MQSEGIRGRNPREESRALTHPRRAAGPRGLQRGVPGGQLRVVGTQGTVPVLSPDSVLQAKAPNAVVLVVGTHLDLIETKFRVERIATLRAYVLALCRSPSGSRATGFPDITCKHLQ